MNWFLLLLLAVITWHVAMIAALGCLYLALPTRVLHPYPRGDQ